MHRVIERVYSMVKTFDKFIIRPENNRFGIGFAREFKKQVLNRFPNFGCEEKVRRVANFIAPQYKGIHLEETNQYEQVIIDIKSYSVSEFMDNSFTENNLNNTSHDQDLSLSPTSLLRKKVRARSQKTHYESSNERLMTPIEKDIEKYSSFSLAASDVDILQWWQKHEKILPILSQIAKQILTIPASSAKSERVFSTGGNIVTKKRNRLIPKHVETLIILKENMKCVTDYKIKYPHNIRKSKTNPFRNITIESTIINRDVESDSLLSNDDIDDYDYESENDDV